MSVSKLPQEFYRRDCVTRISKELLGKVLCTQIAGDPVTRAKIVETEAYCGRNDKACHANNGLRTKRTETMYKAGGTAYVYLCYGIHHLFNVVTNVQGKADAVLIRGVEPLDGISTILERRNASKLAPKVAAGPGRLTQAMGITTHYDGTDLTAATIWIEDHDLSVDPTDIASTPRIGVDYAGEHAKRPWRFFINGNSWVSK